MSYDLQIYAPTALAVNDIRSLVVSAGFGIDGVDPSASSLTVVRGVKRTYSFTLALPVRVEPEDVPDEVTAVALGPSHVYELLVEGSSAVQVPHAVRFGRRLAEAAGGVLVDQQTEEIWSRGKLRQAPRVESGVTATVELHWYVLKVDDGGRAAQAWLTAARRHLPEALPRRFGTYEPLQRRFEDGHDRVFVDFVDSADGSVYFKANRPVTDGSLAAGTTYGGPIQSHGLTLLAEALEDDRWRRALRRLFVDFAQRVDAILATAEVVRGVHWSGRSLGYDSNTERTTYLAGRGIWAGLPPYPVWWTWFGADYVPLVRDFLPPDQVEEHGSSLFHWGADKPTDRELLLADRQAPEHDARPGLFRRKTTPEPQTWLPADLLPIEDQSDPHLYNPPLTPARTRPRRLE